MLERANRVIKQVAETEKYDLILQEAVYINPKHDITDKVLGGLNSSQVRPGLSCQRHWARWSRPGRRVAG